MIFSLATIVSAAFRHDEGAGRKASCAEGSGRFAPHAAATADAMAGIDAESAHQHSRARR
jgi:hypothetical protein